ncbi:MAG: PHP domain-containing protein [Lachnospiraceae bacterium]|nr:PHP domain-containing protein [Lachnospiraceae bacterium]
MENAIDLHVHSTHSDGTFSVPELVEYAHNINLRAIALTDHDCIDGNVSMRTLCQKVGIDFVPGVELSTEFQFPNNGIRKEVHLLGYFIDEKNEHFRQYLSDYLHSRLHRNEQMVEKLQAHGISITLKALEAQYPDSVITRAHMARFLLDSGQVKTMNEAFKKYLGDDAPCFVDRKKVQTADAIQLIHDAGGLTVLAHPPLYNLSHKALDTMICTLKEAGLDGIEAVYSTYHNNEEQDIKAFAHQYDLLITGGSDFHGRNKAYIHLGKGRGNLYVPYELYERLYDAHIR